MAPYSRQSAFPAAYREIDDISVYDQLSKEKKKNPLIANWEKRMGFLTPLVWRNIILILLSHVIAAVWFGYYLSRGWFPKWQTVIFTMVTAHISGFGVTGGVHRLWSHRAYKARWPLRAILLVGFSLAGQNDVCHWVRDHRVHHKFSETDADPHNAERGFFFSHMGWLMMSRHPRVKQEAAKTDMSDVVNDPLVKFHTRYFNVFKLLFCFIIPTLMPALVWHESWSWACLQTLLRYIYCLHCTWAVNSFAHLMGNKPYDSNINPSENWAVSLATIGEGWHNYHHTFPWDYKAAELPYHLNLTTCLLDMFSSINWAYDLKVASASLVKAVQAKRGKSDLLEPHASS